jgi:hypothetical protein
VDELHALHLDPPALTDAERIGAASARLLVAAAVAQLPSRHHTALIGLAVGLQAASRKHRDSRCDEGDRCRVLRIADTLLGLEVRRA